MNEKLPNNNNIKIIAFVSVVLIILAGIFAFTQYKQSTSNSLSQQQDGRFENEVGISPEVTASLCKKVNDRERAVDSTSSVKPEAEHGVYKCASSLRVYMSKITTDAPDYFVYDFEGKNLSSCTAGGYPASMRAEMWPPVCNEVCENINLCKVSEITREYLPGEGVFELKLNADTVRRFKGKNSWTQLAEDYYFVVYQFDENASSTHKSTVRLDEIANFDYNPKKEYNIQIERLRSNKYGIMDVDWYQYKLINVDDEKKIK